MPLRFLALKYLTLATLLASLVAMPVLAQEDIAQEDVASAATPAQTEQNRNNGLAAFTQGDCATAIPLLSNGIDEQTATDDLIVVTQVLSACFASGGDIERARVLMREIAPLIMADKGPDSLAFLDHNLTWAEFELDAGQNINAANRLAEGIAGYLTGDELDADELMRAMAAYASLMAYDIQVDRFSRDFLRILDRSQQVTWTSEQTFADKLDALPIYEPNVLSLVTWAQAALAATDGIEPFDDLLNAPLRVEPEDGN